MSIGAAVLTRREAVQWPGKSCTSTTRRFPSASALSPLPRGHNAFFCAPTLGAHPWFRRSAAIRCQCPGPVGAPRPGHLGTHGVRAGGLCGHDRGVPWRRALGAGFTRRWAGPCTADLGRHAATRWLACPASAKTCESARVRGSAGRLLSGRSTSLSWSWPASLVAYAIPAHCRCRRELRFGRRGLSAAQSHQFG